MFRARTLLLTAIATAAMAAIAVVAWAKMTHGTARTMASSGPFQAVGLLDGSGNPEPSVDYFPDGSAGAIRWSMCRSPGASSCRPIPSHDGMADPGPEPAGTVFTVTAVYRGGTYTSSLTWAGPIGAAAAPALRGHARYGAIVTGTAARWTGGWGTAFDQLGLEACRSVHGLDCVMLSGEQLQCSARGCGSLGGVTGPIRRPNRARIGNWYTGWYLFALDAHLGQDTSGLVGYPSPAAIPPWPRSATVIRSEPYGPVTGPPVPRVRLLSTARVNGDRVAVASLRCTISCRAWVTVSLSARRVGPGGRAAWSASRMITGSGMLAVRGPVPPGRVTDTVHVGDGPYLRGHSLVR